MRRLTRPFCLLELLTAIDEGVPIIGLCLTGNSARAPYDYQNAANYLSRLHSELADSPRAVSPPDARPEPALTRPNLRRPAPVAKSRFCRRKLRALTVAQVSSR